MSILLQTEADATPANSIQFVSLQPASALKVDSNTRVKREAVLPNSKTTHNATTCMDNSTETDIKTGVTSNVVIKPTVTASTALLKTSPSSNTTSSPATDAGASAMMNTSSAKSFANSGTSHTATVTRHSSLRSKKPTVRIGVLDKLRVQNMQSDMAGSPTPNLTAINIPSSILMKATPSVAVRQINNCPVVQKNEKCNKKVPTALVKQPSIESKAQAAGNINVNKVTLKREKKGKERKPISSETYPAIAHPSSVSSATSRCTYPQTQSDTPESQSVIENSSGEMAPASSSPQMSSVAVPSCAGQNNGRVLLPRPPVPILPTEGFQVQLPYGTTKSIFLSKCDLGRHIPVWNCKLKYKLAGTSAPLGRNLVPYLERKGGEFEIYTNQDRHNKSQRKQSARVTLWNKKELRKVSGTSAPLRKNLERYLKEHPECEVYSGQAKTVDSSQKDRLFKRVTLWNKSTQRRTGFGSAGPLRKNLEGYLRRHPHLEEYKGQDKIPLSPVSKVTDFDSGAMKNNVKTHGGNSHRTCRHSDRCQTQTRSGTRRCDVLVKQEDVQIIAGGSHNQQHFQANLSPSPARNGSIAKVSSHKREGMHIDNYCSFDHSAHTKPEPELEDESESKRQSNRNEEEYGAHTGRDEDMSVGRQAASEKSANEPLEMDGHRSIDAFLNMDEDLLLCGLHLPRSPASPHSMDHDYYLNLEVDIDEDSFFRRVARQDPLGPLLPPKSTELHTLCDHFGTSCSSISPSVECVTSQTQSRLFSPSGDSSVADNEEMDYEMSF